MLALIWIEQGRTVLVEPFKPFWWNVAFKRRLVYVFMIPDGYVTDILGIQIGVNNLSLC